MTRFALLPLILLAAACATPREACIAEATEDLRVVDRLIAQDEETLARGYALERRIEYRPRLTVCTGVGYGGWSGYRGDYFGTGACIDREPTTRTVAVAVDLAGIRGRLAGLREKRAELAPEAERRVAACQRAYPGG